MSGCSLTASRPSSSAALASSISRCARSSSPRWIARIAFAQERIARRESGRARSRAAMRPAIRRRGSGGGGDGGGGGGGVAGLHRDEEPHVGAEGHQQDRGRVPHGPQRRNEADEAGERDALDQDDEDAAAALTRPCL